MSFFDSILNFFGINLTGNKENDNNDSQKQKQQKNIIKKLEIKVFVPNPNFFYCYFIEEKKSPDEILNLQKEAFQIEYASDIQRYCYYPETETICTFMGFSTTKQLLKGIKSPALKHHTIYEYSGKRKKSKKSENQEFVPKENLIYYFFIEKSNSQDILTEIKNASNIQRFCFFPGTKDIFTFIGFRKHIQEIQNQEILKSIRRLAKNDENIYIYWNNTQHNSTKTEFQSNNNQNATITYKHLNNTNSLKRVNDFIPKGKFFYCYLKERDHSKDIYQFKFLGADDIQRFCYYPKTQDIFTFIGFIDKRRRDLAIQNRTLISYSKDYIIYTYVHSSKEILDYYKEKEIEEDKERKKEKEKEKIEYLNSNPVPIEFIPKSNLFYFYFKEEKYSNVDKLLSAPDVQRNCYYPNTKFVFSFFGFTSKEIGVRTINNSCLDLRMHDIKTYIPQNFKCNNNNNQQQNSNDLKFEIFCPKKNCFYLYFKEVQDPDQSLSRKNYSKLFGIRNASDIQRFRHLDATNDIFTFVGFNEKQKMDKALQKISLKSAANKGEIFIYKQEKQQTQNNDNKNENKANINDKVNNEAAKSNNEKVNNDAAKANDDNADNEKVDNDAAKANNAKVDTKNEKVDNNKADSSSVSTNSGEKNDVDEPLFSPKEDLYYLFFREFNLADKNRVYSNAKLYNVSNIIDLQRGFKMNAKDPIYYTFFGFFHSLERSKAVSTLKKETEYIESSSIKIIDDDYDDDESESEDDSNSRMTSNTNLQNQIENKNISKFNQAMPQNTDSNKTSKVETKNDSNKTDSRFSYKPQQDNNSNAALNSNINNSSNNSNGNNNYNSSSNNNNSSAINNAKNDFNNENSKFHYRPEQSSEPQHQDQDISLLLPKFNKFSDTNFSYRIFAPKPNFVYFFFAEINKPSMGAVYTSYTKLFGIKNASDIQRFRYYPGSNCVYTFIGFTDKENLKKAVFGTTVKTNAVNLTVYDYPYKTVSSTSSAAAPTSNSSQSKEQTNMTINSNQTNYSQSKANQKSQNKNKFVYRPDQNSSSTEESKKTTTVTATNSNESNSIITNSSSTNETQKFATDTASNNDKSDVIDANSSSTKIATDENSNNNDNKNDKSKSFNNSFDDDDDDDNSDNKEIINGNNNGNDNENAKIENNDDENEMESSNDDDSTLFSPNEDLYYVYFKEKSSIIERCKLNNTEMFGICNIKDLQRGFQLSDDDPEFYTFLGFSQSIDLNAAINVLHDKPKIIDTSSIQKFIQNEDTDEDDDDDDYDENSITDADFDDDDEIDEINIYTEDIIQHVQRAEKVSPKERIRISS